MAGAGGWDNGPINRRFMQVLPMLRSLSAFVSLCLFVFNSPLPAFGTDVSVAQTIEPLHQTLAVSQAGSQQLAGPLLLFLVGVIGVCGLCLPGQEYRNEIESAKTEG